VYGSEKDKEIDFDVSWDGGDFPDTKPPPVSEDTDLRHLPSAMIPVTWIRDSELALLGSAEGFKAALTMWALAWHEVPAGSLPANERLLAARAGYGDEVAWSKIKKEALGGFELHSDGRMYHPELSKIVKQVWANKQGNTKRLQAANEARLRKAPAKPQADKRKP
jgi:hypothetical protein